MANLPVWTNAAAAGARTWQDGPVDYSSRPLPNEDVALWIKSFDNSRVVPRLDPKVRLEHWRYITMCTLTATLVVGLLLPAAYGMLTGYRIQRLEEQRQSLAERRKMLLLEQSRLETPANLEVWARQLRLRPPAPQDVFYLQASGDQSLALNLNKR